MESRRWSLSCEDFDCPSIILPLSFAQNDWYGSKRFLWRSIESLSLARLFKIIDKRCERSSRRWPQRYLFDFGWKDRHSIDLTLIKATPQLYFFCFLLVWPLKSRQFPTLLSTRSSCRQLLSNCHSFCSLASCSSCCCCCRCS
jgi:hypothetical protein